MVIRGRLRAPVSFLIAAGLGLFASAQTPAMAAPRATAAPVSKAAGGAGVNPYSPAYQHPYRHGVVPTIQQNAKMKSWADAQRSATVAPTGPETLSYGGGVDGVGVQSGHSKVYLVFYGSQWGTQGSDGNGDATFSGDPYGAAPVAQEMFKDIGTGGELWSADLTQWCDGPNVQYGATSCPSTADFIPYQSGGVLSGVWYDDSAPSPSAATGHQLGVEAVNAAAHFGNTTAASNRDAYYVILSPHGTNPDAYQGQYCAWHDWNGDTTLNGGAIPSNYGDIAFSNQPYNMDAGANCGVGFINRPGTLDGWTITLGHEWHEMMSDQNPAGGWTNNTGSSWEGQENSDECAWLRPGTNGGAANVQLGGGTFAEQASWSNDTNACAISHPIVGGDVKHNVITVTDPGNQSGFVGTAISRLQVTASDADPGQTLTFSALGLPPGLAISGSGEITGTPTAKGTFAVSVVATDGTGSSDRADFTWSVDGNTVTVTGPGDQTGVVDTAAALQITASDSDPGQTLAFTATGLPPGLAISSSGKVTGTPTAKGTFAVTVVATDGTGISGSTAFSWLVYPNDGCVSRGQQLGNPGFESGAGVAWTAGTGVIDDLSSEPARSGSWKAWLDGYGAKHTDTLSQKVTVPAGCSATLTFYLHVDTAETSTLNAYDKLVLQLGKTTLATYSNLDAKSGYVLKSVDLSAYAGQTVTLKFTGTEDASLQTSFVIDDTALQTI